MKDFEWTNPNRPKSMPSGPWVIEPDKAQFLDKDTGYPCLLRRGGGGAWCGYVGVPPSHPLYGMSAELTQNIIPFHGGISFAGRCQEKEGGICHEVEEGDEDNVWWLGFACVADGDAGTFWDGDPRSVIFNYHGIQRGRADREKELLGGEPDGYVVYRNWNEQIIGKEKIHKNIFLAWASINPYHYQEEVKEMLVENGWEVHSVKIIKMEKV